MWEEVVPFRRVTSREKSKVDSFPSVPFRRHHVLETASRVPPVTGPFRHRRIITTGYDR